MDCGDAPLSQFDREVSECPPHQELTKPVTLIMEHEGAKTTHQRLKFRASSWIFRYRIICCSFFRA